MAFFKEVYNGDGSNNQAQALFGYCPSFDPSMTFQKVKGVLEESDETHIREVIGEDFYDELQAAYDSNSLSAAQSTFILLLRKASAWFCFAEASIKLSVQMSDLGGTEVIDTQAKAAAPRQWVSVSNRADAFKTGYRRLEAALKYLEKHPDDYLTWKNSDAFSRTHELFFRSGGELSEYMPIRSYARIVFLRMRPAIREAERRYIRPVLGSSFYAEFKGAFKTDELSDTQKELLDLIRFALAKWAQVCALPSMRLQMVNGLVEPYFDDGIIKRKPASEDVVRSLWVSNQDAGELFLAELKTFLDQHADSFPTYKSSHQYNEGKGSEGPMSQEDENGRPYNVVSLL